MQYLTNIWGDNMGKYSPISDFFAKQTAKSITLSMKEIENIIQDTLPPSAYNHVQWWGNSKTNAHPYSRSWTDNGYRTVDVQNTIHNQRITFEK